MQLCLFYIQIIPTFVASKKYLIISRQTMSMKKRNLLFASCFISVLSFSSCEKNLYDESKQPERETHMTDLVVPYDFSWTSSQVAKMGISSQIATTVYVYLEPECTEDALLLKMKIEPGTIPALPLEIPAYVENVYVKYEGSTKVFTTPVNANGSISITVPANFEISITKAITRADGKGDGNKYTPEPGSGNNILVYPGKGYATVLFEDMYPQLGDYDFNDLVAWYKLQIPDFRHQGNEYFTDIMYIGFQIRAIGGIHEYDPYIRLTDIRYDELDIEETEMYIARNNPGNDIKVLEGPNHEVIISYTKPAIPSGQEYFNVEADKKTTPDHFTAVYLVFKSEVNITRIQDSKIDIYLGKKNNGQEIHLKGYSSVYGTHQEYFDANNFVWGLKAAAPIYHTIEGTNFLKAYPKFEKWITSGGKENKRWWNAKKNDLLIIN